MYANQYQFSIYNAFSILMRYIAFFFYSPEYSVSFTLKHISAQRSHISSAQQSRVANEGHVDGAQYKGWHAVV